MIFASTHRRQEAQGTRVALVLALLLVLTLVVPSVGQTTNSTEATNTTTGILQFLDGSLLHGKLLSVDPSKGLAWAHPDAKNPIQFRETNIEAIRFEKSKPIVPSSTPTCWFRFVNGDEVFGDLVGLDEHDLRLRTWLGDDLKSPRRSLRSIYFLPKDFSLFYEGPNGLDDWTLGKGPRVWQYKDGALVADGVGMIGRDFKLSGSATIEFDLAWSGPFSLIMPFYTRALDRFDYSASSYMFYIRPGNILLQRVQGGSGSMTLGQADVPEMLKKNFVHLEIQANKEEASITVLADGKVVHRWSDSNGFVGEGTGLVFYAQLNGPTIRISNIKVSQGDGGLTRPGDKSTSSQDFVLLVNRDKMSGTLQKVEEGKLTFVTPQTSVQLPLQRVSRIFFSEEKPLPAAPRPWQVQAHFSGGGSVTFQLERWTHDEVAGQSQNFGPIHFNPDHIRHLQFNLDRAVAAALHHENEESFDTFPE